MNCFVSKDRMMIRTHYLLRATVLPLALMTGMVASAKLPPPSDEAKAKAAETAAKTAWSGKVGAYQLCKSQDKVARAYLAGAKNGVPTGAAGRMGTVSAAADAPGWRSAAMPMGSATSVAEAGSSPAAAPAATVVAGMPPLSTPATAQPVAMPGCADPGAFTYVAESAAPPPLESAGAHSPAKTATAPPQGAATSAEQNPAPKTK